LASYLQQANYAALFPKRLNQFNFTNRYDDALKELLTKGFGVRLAKQPQIVVPPPPKVVTPPRTIINPQDGKEMLLVPAGEFVIGKQR